jgi:hypothetical protein
MVASIITIPSDTGVLHDVSMASIVIERPILVGKAPDYSHCIPLEPLPLYID